MAQKSVISNIIAAYLVTDVPPVPWPHSLADFISAATDDSVH